MPIVYNGRSYSSVVKLIVDQSKVRSIIDKSIKTYEDSELQVIGQYAFRDCVALRTLNCPKVRRVEESALDGAGYNNDGVIVTLDWDNLEYLGQRSLAGIKNTSFVTSAPVVISNTWVFYEANIVNFDAPNARLEHDGDTRNLFSRTNLVNTDGVKSLFSGHRLEHTFVECRDLVNVDLENIYHIGDSVFRWCNNLETVHIATRPKHGADWLFDNAFGDCSSLKTVVIEGVVNNFGNGVFSGCSSLESFTLTNSDAVRNMYQYGKSADEFFGYGCNPNVNIYVPADIVDSLKEAWSDRADHIFPIE